MKDYTILIPFTGYVSVGVKAETTDEAIEKAWKIASLEEHVEEWDLHKEVNGGNVSHALLNEMEIYED